MTKRTNKENKNSMCQGEVKNSDPKELFDFLYS